MAYGNGIGGAFFPAFPLGQSRRRPEGLEKEGLMVKQRTACAKWYVGHRKLEGRAEKLAQDQRTPEDQGVTVQTRGCQMLVASKGVP
jgi:hypothetical protein